jgi:N-sulfoglucosamine sulfohydrolase
MSATRRELLLTLAAGAAAVKSAESVSSSKPPNILFILSDDHSVPFLGAYGASYMSTPHLDRFAGESLRFDKAFTAAPQCVPSRAALMTGRSPIAIQMGRFGLPLPKNVTTLPEELRKLGYHTGLCGRYFHLDGVIAPNPVTKAVYEKHRLQTWAERVDFKDVSPQTQTADKFQQFLGQVPAGRPWFFWINYSDPHHPWDKDAGHVDPAKVQLPPYLPDLPGVREDLADYCREVERLDGFFGEDLAVLRKAQAEDNTVIVFMGDNGQAFPHGKGALYDPGLHVPLIVHWPGKTKPGATDALISGEDLAPTLLEIAGGTPPPEMTGRSFRNLLTGNQYEPRKYVFASRIHHGNGSFSRSTKADEFDLSRCVRSERWKVIYNCTPHMEYQPVDSAKNPGWLQMVDAQESGHLPAEFGKAYFELPRPVLEMYDLHNDRAEFHNLAANPELADLLHEHLAVLQEKMITDHDYLPSPLGDSLPKEPVAKRSS